MKEQAELKIYGKVQGVGFRANTKRKAKKYGLVGWVRNNDDGTVTVVAQGKKEDLGQLVNWAKKGPSLARVEKIETDWQETKQEFSDFSIRY